MRNESIYQVPIIGEVTDYIYCQDCEEYENLLRYGKFDNHEFRVELTGHIDHNWRYIRGKELSQCQELPLFIPLTRYEATLLFRGLRLFRWNSMESDNEDKKHRPTADKLISKLEEAL